MDPELPEVNRTPDERAALVEMLDYYRAVLKRKASGLTDDQLASRLEPADLTIGGLLLHMALVEDSWFQDRFLGEGLSEPWSEMPWEEDPDFEFHSANLWGSTDLLRQFDESVQRSRSVIEAAESLDVVAAKTTERGSYNLRWILVHLIEEYARHCGHADLIRESIDGVVGD